MERVDRDALTSEVLGRLADPSFARLLRATTADGARPIVVARREDAFADVLSEVDAAGGAGNLVVPLSQGYIIVTIAIGAASPKDRKGHQPEHLTAQCTVGVLLARLLEDGDQERTYIVHRSERGRRDDQAKANLVGASA